MRLQPKHLRCLDELLGLLLQCAEALAGRLNQGTPAAWRRLPTSFCFKPSTEAGFCLRT